MKEILYIIPSSLIKSDKYRELFIKSNYSPRYTQISPYLREGVHFVFDAKRMQQFIPDTIFSNFSAAIVDYSSESQRIKEIPFPKPVKLPPTHRLVKRNVVYDMHCMHFVHVKRISKEAIKRLHSHSMLIYRNACFSKKGINSIRALIAIPTTYFKEDKHYTIESIIKTDRDRFQDYSRRMTTEGRALWYVDDKD